MIGWAQIRPVLIEVFTEISADTTRSQQGFKAEWQNGRAGFISPEQKFLPRLKVVSVSGIGEDETRRETSVDGTIAEKQVGQRRFTLQVQIVCVEDTDEVWSMAATERIRTRIMRPRIVDRLASVGVDARRVGNAVKATFKDGGRVVNAANIDVFMGAVVNDADPIPVGPIDYVVATGRLKDVDGVELPHPPNWTNNEIPEIPDL